MSAPVDPLFSRRVPPGEDRERLVCERCAFVAYENPKIVVGSVVRHEGRILLCRRAIEPRAGFWTLPAGYMELNETPEEGAAREAREEAGAELVVGPLLAIYSVPRISQVQLIFRARLAAPRIAPGRESLDARLFRPEDIPFDALAFPSVHWALAHDRLAESGEGRPPFGNPEGETGGRMPDGTPLGEGQF